jgi:hypothetical protein
MVRETHADPGVISLLNEKFIPVRLEGRGHVDLAQKFNVRGVPTTVILSPQEQEIFRLDGFKTGEEYTQELQKVK